MKWKVKWLPEAFEDLEDLDKGIRLRVLKAIVKLEEDPLNYGEPLGEKMGIDLSGMRKIKPARGYRVVYHVEKDTVVVLVVAVDKREDFKAYKTAARRIAEYRKKVGKELNMVVELLKLK